VRRDGGWNAFSELNDAEEQAQRFATQESGAGGGDAEAEPGDPDYVEANVVRHGAERRLRRRRRPVGDGAAREGRHRDVILSRHCELGD